MRSRALKAVAFLKPKRRWLQFSLRTLFVLTTLFALWIGWRVHLVRKHKQAVDAIQQLGGSIQFHSDLADDAEPSTPPWVENLLAKLFPAKVHSVYFPDSTTDADLAHLAAFQHTERLDLDNTQISDAGLEHVGHLARLRILSLNNTRVGDNGLAHLESLSNLAWLELRNTHVTDDGLVHLKDMTKLESMWLGNARVRGPGLRHLKGLKSLIQLSLDGNPVSDEGVRHLAGLPALQSLTLDKSAVTDACVEHLERFPALQVVDLTDTSCSLDALRKLKRRKPRLGIIGPDNAVISTDNSAAANPPAKRRRRGTETRPLGPMWQGPASPRRCPGPGERWAFGPDSCIQSGAMDCIDSGATV